MLEKIETLLEKADLKLLRKASEELSRSYREKNCSESIFADPMKRLAYLAVRFPATFAAVQFVLSELCKRNPSISVKRVLDLGSGPATATLAAYELWPEIETAVLIEKNRDAIALGKELLSQGEWICRDLKEQNSFPKSDLAILSYALGEIKPLEPLLHRLWQSDIDTFAIIEPGTMAGYRTILQAREFLLKNGASIIAPCPHTKACPIKAGDWCHFAVRLERTKMHRMLKEGTLGFEDEKFSYLIVSKTHFVSEGGDRILRHPFKGSGHVKLSLCTEQGNFEERTISRKDKDDYKRARDAKWGGFW